MKNRVFHNIVIDFENIRAIVEDRLALDGYTEEYAISADEVADSVARMKSNKNDAFAPMIRPSNVDIMERQQTYNNISIYCDAETVI